MQYAIIAILFFFLFTNTIQCSCQSNYTVIYNHSAYLDSNANKPFKELKGALYVMNDTMTVYRIIRKEKDLMQKLNLSSSDAHHGTINPLKLDFYYSVVHLNNEDFDIKIPRDTTKWIIDSTKPISILDIKCFSAQADNTIIWFAPSIPLKAGPVHYFGLPGLVLAVYNSKYNFVYMASKIIPEIPEIIRSKKTTVKTLEEYKALQKIRVSGFSNQPRIKTL